MKLLATWHPSYVQRGNWPALSSLRRDLMLALQEGWFPEVRRHPVTYLTRPTPLEFKPYVRLGDKRPLYFDIETPYGIREIICVGVSRTPYDVCVVPWVEPFRSMLRSALLDPTCLKVAQNMIFDVPILEEDLHIEIALPWFDTIVAHSDVEPDLAHGLAELAKDFYDGVPWKGDQTHTLETYCCIDVDVTARAHVALDALIDEYGVRAPFERDTKALRIAMEMEASGVRINLTQQAVLDREFEVLERDAKDAAWGETEKHPTLVAKAASLLEEATTLVATAEANWIPGKKREMGKLKTKAKRLREKALLTTRPNLGSPKQLKDLLYKDMGFPTQRDSDKKITTNEDALLEVFRKEGEPARVCKHILDFREYHTVRSKYLSYEEEVVHPRWLIYRAATGRWACREPNLQNIPNRAEYAHRIRSMFEPVHPGWMFTGRDYSQIEARLQAHLSQDPVLVGAFERGEDIHCAVAGMALNKLASEVTPTERYTFKRAVYLESYGGGWLRLQRALAAENVLLSVAKCKEVLTRLREARPVLTAYREALVERANRARMLRTPFGRIRWFLGPAFGDALNFPFQSCTADIILEAMVVLREALPKPARMTIQIHDELIVEHPPHLQAQVDEVMREVMERPVPELGGWSCPTEGKSGYNLAFK